MKTKTPAKAIATAKQVNKKQTPSKKQPMKTIPKPTESKPAKPSFQTESYVMVSPSILIADETKNPRYEYGDIEELMIALTSILIYQGLTTGELAQLKVNHVDLDNGLIYVKGSKNMAHRHVEIQPKQYRILDRYMTESRKELLRVETDNLLVGKLGTPITTDDVQYIISTMKGLFPDRNLTPQTIRQSVIANWLNEKKIPLEQVQLMSGQKWISTTLKYRENNAEEKRELMNKWFPI